MITQEVIKNLELAKANMLDEYSADFQIAFDAAIEALQKQEIIHCGECRYSMTHTNTELVHLCKCWLNGDSEWLNADEDFCSQAERREE